MIEHVHSAAVRRVSSACLALWVVAFVACSLHCTLGSLAAKPMAADHSCCAHQDKTADSSSAAKGNCHVFRDLAAADSALVKDELAPQLVATVVPFLVSWFAAPVAIEHKAFAPEPDVGPPSHLPLMRLAGRAPPALV